MAVKTQTFRKDPEATLDYGFDWSEWLMSGEIIQISNWTVPIGITANETALGDSTTKIWLSGGAVGETYVIANKVTTSGGRVDERSFEVIVENR